MPHSFSTHFRTGYFDTTTITNNPFIAHTFIFTAMAFPVLCWTKNSFAKQPIFFWFQCTVIDRFRFFYFPAVTTNEFYSGDARPIFIYSKLLTSSKGLTSYTRFTCTRRENLHLPHMLLLCGSDFLRLFCCIFTLLFLCFAVGKISHLPVLLFQFLHGSHRVFLHPSPSFAILSLTL